jgi:transposase-like protein
MQSEITERRIKRRLKYSEEFKLQAVNLSCESGKTVTEVAQVLGVAQRALYKWRAQRRETPPPTVGITTARANTDEWAVPVKTSFDATWCADTNQYLTDAELETALRELVRVTLPADWWQSKITTLAPPHVAHLGSGVPSLV